MTPNELLIQPTIVGGVGYPSLPVSTTLAQTLTVAQLLSGYITVDPAGTDIALTLPTAAAMIPELLPTVGSQYTCRVVNSADADEIIKVTANTGTTISRVRGGLPCPELVATGETATLVFVRTSDSAVVCYVSNNWTPSETAITAAGDTALTRAQMRTGVIEYDCGGSARAPTFPVAADFVSGLLSFDGASVAIIIKNTSDAAEAATLSTATGLTLTTADGTSDAAVGQNEGATVLVTRTSATTCDVRITVF